MTHRIGVILSNLRAEGGPVLAADLIDVWRNRGIDPVVLLLNDEYTDLLERFQQFDVPIEQFNVPGIGLRHYPALFAKTLAACRKHKIDAVVSIPTGVHGILFAGARAAGVRRTVVHVGNYPWHWEPHFPKYRKLMRLSRLATDHVVCVSDHVREGVLEHFGQCGRRSVTVVRNGIDLGRFSKRNTPSRSNRIIMVARLESGKDHAILIAAVALLVRKGVNIRLQLVGTGDLEPGLWEQVQATGLDGAIEFLGMRTDIPALLADARGFVFSVRPEEGLGIALAEAMATGLPCVATDVGACREVTANGMAGLLVPPGDAPALAEALERVLVDDTLAGSLGQAARARVEAEYDREVMASRYLKLLQGNER